MDRDVDDQLGELSLGIGAQCQVSGQCRYALAGEDVQTLEALVVVAHPVQRMGAHASLPFECLTDQTRGEISRTCSVDGFTIGADGTDRVLEQVDLVGRQVLVLVVDPLEASLLDSLTDDVAGHLHPLDTAQGVDLDDDHG